MTVCRTDSLLGRFCEFLAGEIGLHFPPERAVDLMRGIRTAAPDFGFDNVPACMQWLMRESLNKAQIEILASHLTIGETYFFRDQKTFDALEDHVLREFIGRRRDGEQRLRLWSAACCSGEEPYSLAIALAKVLPDLKDWQATILASDINPRFLQKAARGVYSDWSFRSAPSWLKERYFKQTDHRHWQIHADIKRMVTFSHLNLAEDVYPSLLNDTQGMDVIFCRNVLIYFAPEQAKKVIENLYRCLNEGGWLVLGPSESAHVLFPQFVPVNIDGAIYYKKDSTRMIRLPMPASRLEEIRPLVVQPEIEVAPERCIRAAPLSEPVATPRAGYDEALGLYHEGSYIKAVVALEGLLASEPRDSQLMVLLARIQANQGRLTDALCWCDRLVAADKLDPTAHYLRASVLNELGNTSEAVQSFHRAIYLDPDFVLSHFALGNLARSEGKVREGNKHFQNALALSRQHPQDHILKESEGITAGRLAKIIVASMEAEGSA